jgi:hypothetical protein
MLKKHGEYYQFIVFEDKEHEWVYEIYSLGAKPLLIVESDEWFESEGEAGLAAIGHISLLENGEG